LAEYLNAMAKEGEGMRLVRSLEEFRGCTLQIAGKRTGFNGISVCNGDILRKIELKTVDSTDYWFAINGLYGIQSLFFDPQYYLYFALIRQRKIVIARGNEFLQAQIPTYNADIAEEMRTWIGLTRDISVKAGLNIIPRINFKLKVGLRLLVQTLEAAGSEQQTEQWKRSIDSVWQGDEEGDWQMTYPQAAIGE